MEKKSAIQNLESQLELLKALEKEFGSEYHLEPSKSDQFGTYQLGWILLESTEPTPEYIEKFQRLIKVLGTYFMGNNPIGFFTLDNNIGDQCISFKVYLTEV